MRHRLIPYRPILPPPKVTNPAIRAIKATAPNIINHRGNYFSVGSKSEPV
jgi:hypothetical protein